MSRVSKKKLLILSPSLAGGGFERVISLISLNAPRDVDVSIGIFKKIISYPVRSPVYLLGDYNNIFAAFKAYINLNKLIYRLKPDSLIFFGIGQGLGVSLLSISKNKFLSVRNYRFEPNKHLLYKKIYFKLLFALCTKILTKKIIVNSLPIKQKLLEEYRIRGNKVKVIYNPVDLKMIKELASMHIDINEAEVFKHPVIINVGRMINQKGQWHLIRAFKLVNEEIPNTRLVILGEGKLRDYLVRLINELKLNDNMYLPGWKSNPFKYMARSTLFCLSSLWEGFPNVVVEALACGLPVMSTDCLSGPREILAPGTEYKVDRLKGPEYAEYGILMPVFDGKRYTARDPLTWQEEMWAEEIVKLLKNPEILENYRQRAKRRAMDFEAKKQVQKYFDVIFNQS
ncbi:MAG: glycosyltransferase [Nitrososphaerota archaeon]